MELEVLVPAARRISLDELLTWTRQQPVCMMPFAAEITDFCAGFSQRLFRDREAARHPDLAALAFWMRKAELLRLRDDFQRLAGAETVMLPRGLVFHLPPGNVDTIFIYSWLLAALTGNRNVVRLSTRRAPQSEILIRLLREAMAETCGPLLHSTMVVSYGHEQQITEALSGACDVRVIWGGDHTVASIRSIPLPPHARELTFPDRSSLAVIHAESYLKLGEDARNQLAERFFNDAYWFDQMACSSPRLLVWCGTSEQADQATRAFWTCLEACMERKHYQGIPAVQMQKFVFACQAILKLPVSEYRSAAEATILGLESLKGYSREHCGGGLFFSARVDALADLAPILYRKDQTMGYFGFSSNDLRSFALHLAGGGVDRIVPIGQALQFSRYWDGYDLIREFCRSLYIAGEPPAAE